MKSAQNVESHLKSSTPDSGNKPDSNSCSLFLENPYSKGLKPNFTLNSQDDVRIEDIITPPQVSPYEEIPDPESDCSDADPYIRSFDPWEESVGTLQLRLLLSSPDSGNDTPSSMDRMFSPLCTNHWHFDVCKVHTSLYSFYTLTCPHETKIAQTLNQSLNKELKEKYTKISQVPPTIEDLEETESTGDIAMRLISSSSEEISFSDDYDDHYDVDSGLDEGTKCPSPSLEEVARNSRLFQLTHYKFSKNLAKLQTNQINDSKSFRTKQALEKAADKGKIPISHTMHNFLQSCSLFIKHSKGYLSYDNILQVQRMDEGGLLDIMSDITRTFSGSGASANPHEPVNPSQAGASQAQPVGDISSGVGPDEVFNENPAQDDDQEMGEEKVNFLQLNKPKITLKNRNLTYKLQYSNKSSINITDPEKL